jgi:hypothetical protein
MKTILATPTLPAMPAKGQPALRITLSMGMQAGEVVTHIQNVDNGGKGSGNYFHNNLAGALQDFHERAKRVFGRDVETSELVNG